MANFDDPVRPSQPMDPIEHPLDLLLKEHDMVRKLAAKYCGTDDKEVKKQAAKQLIHAIHMHSRVEESVFYPDVRQVDAAMIGHFEQEHQKVDDLIATLEGMNLEDAHADRLMNELIPAVLHHIDQEEKEFFPKLERQHMDMAPVGLQMQSFEANLLAMQAKASENMRR